MFSMIKRRQFLSSATAVSAGFFGLHDFLANSATAAPTTSGYGPPRKDPDGILDLPNGFRYSVISRAGDTMSDALKVPEKADGMGAFAGPNGSVILLRNHEIDPGQGPKHQTRDVLSLPASKVYDRGFGRAPALGGVTTVIVDKSHHKVIRQHMSLTGTVHNCAGGSTPWGSWISCEESVARAGSALEKDHGYCFEVPATNNGVVDPMPIKTMGRFNHEAIAFHPPSGVIYLTEDRHDGLIYRYLPREYGNLLAGGKLQALAILDRAESTDTRNWKETKRPALPVREQFAVRWVDVPNVEAPADDLRLRGAAQHGAAVFARGEGIFYGNDAIYWACTNGGHKKAGQIFRYVPSPDEGKAGESKQPGKLELFVEPNDTKILKNADNLCVSPWGDLIVCEDSKKPNCLIGITPVGECYTFARVSKGGSEFAGSIFSPDGRTLFVNIQNQGLTLAISGPWSA
ncbi:MAG: secreted PhoX family phosphatase [Rhodothermales bacterium]|jgi:secreted PhoX family phosphatase